MAILIKIKSEPEVEKILLKARKSIDGNIIVSDHPEIDILIITGQNKLVALPKEQLDDEVYDSQKRLFDFLVLKGVVQYDTVQAGNLFMSQEGKIPEAKEGDNIQYLLYALHQFIDKELPFYSNQKDYEKQMEKNLLDPEPDEYTEFDPELHDSEKGTLSPGRFGQYGIHKIYRL
jgi:hypothetical protein